MLANLDLDFMYLALLLAPNCYTAVDLALYYVNGANLMETYTAKVLNKVFTNICVHSKSTHNPK